MYSFDFRHILLKLAPSRRRRAIDVRSWFYCIAKALQTINSSLNSTRDAIIYKTNFNAQVIYLEHFLNDKYDPVNRGIYIEDTANTNYLYLYNIIEGKQTYMYNESEGNPLYFRNEAEYNTDVDYKVKVPSSVTYVEKEMRNQILTYNNAARRFVIETI
ncbi:hypothetical protein N9H19_02615 [Flavobacteriales bacterium]|nr:hypothetical protein [Flavobacteriales bacterium]